MVSYVSHGLDTASSPSFLSFYESRDGKNNCLPLEEVNAGICKECGSQNLRFGIVNIVNLELFGTNKWAEKLPR